MISHPSLHTRALCAFAAYITLCIPALARAQEFVNEEVFPSDLRVIEANALLEDRKSWDRAVELYRAALADDPEDLEARIWLARVLSWDKRYDEAFAQYYELLDRTPTSKEVRTEYAEVLSWAGRYDESEKIFQALLAEDPESRRAALGLARVYKWSGRTRQAQRAYERVLATGEDEEIRGELDEIESEAGFGTHAKADSDFVSDSDDFQMFRTGARGSTDLNPETRVLVRAGYTKVSNSLALGRDHSDGFDLLAGVHRVLGKGLTMSIQAGARRWSSSPNTALAHAELQYTPSPRTAAGFQLDYGDFLERSLSLDAVLQGVNETRGRVWLWRELTDSIQGYAYFEASYLSDSNARISGGLSTEWNPWRDWPVSFGVGLNTMSYTSRSLLYYDPSLDLAAVVFSHGGFELHRNFDFDLRVSIGVGHARESGVAATGLTYSVEGGPAWHYDAWQVGLVGRYSQTIRGTTYTSQSVGVTLGRGF